MPAKRNWERMMGSLLMAWSLTMGAGMGEARFHAARPIWPAGREKQLNVYVGFRAIVEPPAAEPVVLRMTGSTVYRIFVNGEFAGHGPARGPHGHYRVDEWDLTGQLARGRNIVAIEVAGYNTNSYAYLDQPSFLQAEIVAGGKVLAATGGGGGKDFEAVLLTERLQRVRRYSFQRPASEVYRLKPGYDAWRRDPASPVEPVKCATFNTVNLLPRRVAYPRFDRRPVTWHVSSGTLEPGRKVESLWRDRALTNIGPKLKGFPEGELETIPSIELQTVGTRPGARIDRALDASARLSLDTNAYDIVDIGTNLTGFLGARISCAAPTRLFFAFDEILVEGDVVWQRGSCVNVVAVELQPGDYAFESFEPYTFRYLKLMVLDGACVVEGRYLRELVNPDVHEAHFAASDPRLNRLFEAGVETFRQNALDVFMDCPSRERAGWLCDSFFTARVAVDLMGDTTIEKNFCENYLLPAGFKHLPEGMLPMCYPSDHYDGIFIPNWALWFVVELEEYLARSGDREMVDALKPRVMKLFEYFKRFRNASGLLEKLESWVFVEWSKANDFVQDVNYPSNMLYAGSLAAAGRMYALPELTAEADRLKEVIRKQSFDGQFFVDNAVRKGGKLEVTRNRSETCQYYAFFFDLATPETHGELWRTLERDFGPRRSESKAFPEIHPSNSFIGNMLRIEMLSRHGRPQQILDESIDYLLYMADRTGTLWENTTPAASCNHGFASHIVHTLYRDILGIRSMDPVNRTLTLRPADVKLDWCEGRLPTPDGPVTLRWWREGNTIAYRLAAPAGYKVEEAHTPGLNLKRVP